MAWTVGEDELHASTEGRAELTAEHADPPWTGGDPGAALPRVGAPGPRA